MAKERIAGFCRSCGKPLNAKNACRCPQCGEQLCADCARKENGVCRRCFTPMDRLS